MIEKGLVFDADHPGLLALNSRNLVREGDEEAAEEQYRKAIRRYGQLKEVKRPVQPLWQPSHQCAAEIALVNWCSAF